MESESATKYPDEVTNEGSKIVEELLRTWVDRCASSSDGDDIIMEDTSATDRELSALQQCLEDYRERIEGNPWIQSLLTTL